MSSVTIRVDQQTKRLLAKQARQSKESIGQVVARKHLAGEFWQGVADDYDRTMKSGGTRRGIERDAASVDAASAEAVRKA